MPRIIITDFGTQRALYCIEAVLTMEGRLVKTIWTLSVSIFLFAYIMIVAPINNTTSSTISPKVDEIIKTNQQVKRILKKDISKYVYVKQEKFTVDEGMSL